MDRKPPAQGVNGVRLDIEQLVGPRLAGVLRANQPKVPAQAATFSRKPRGI